MTQTAPTRFVCQPWATLDDLPAEDKRPGQLDDDEWTELLWRASETLYAFSGKQFAGGCESTVVIDSRPGPGASRDACWTPVGEWASATLAGSAGRPVRWARGRVVVLLPGPPVTAVSTVTLGGETAEFDARLPVGEVWLANGSPWPTDGTAAITYNHGIAPPSGGRHAAVQLALELGKATDEESDCALPQRITSLVREGITVSVMDTFDHLDQKRTGLLLVDMWLAEVNPEKFARRPSVWSPDKARTRRTP